MTPSRLPTPLRALVGVVLALCLTLLAACPPKSPPKKRTPTWKTEPRPVKPKDPPPPKHKSHEHAHGGHPHDDGGHHHHPHPHPHMDGANGHHHPY